MSKWLPNFMSNFLSAVFLKVLENGESFFISISLLFICTWWYALFTFILNDILIGYEIVGSKFLSIVSRFQVLFHAFSISCVLFVCKCFCFLDAFKVLQLYLTFLNFTKLYLFLCVYVWICHLSCLALYKPFQLEVSWLFNSEKLSDIFQVFLPFHIFFPFSHSFWQVF